MDIVLYSLIPFVLFLIIFGIYSFYRKINGIFEKFSQEQELLMQHITYAKEILVTDNKKLSESLEETRKQLTEQQGYNQERFKYLLTDTKQITQYLQEYRREILVSQAANAPMENDISKVTDASVDLSDGVTAFPMHDNLKVQIDDGPAVSVHVTQNIPDDNALPQA